MKVFIIRTENCAYELAEKTAAILQNVNGPVEFVCVNKAGQRNDVPLNSRHAQFFKTAVEFRNEKNIQTEDFVVLLTETPNLENWFSAFDSKNNAYIHTGQWELFTDVTAEYPIAYSIVENLIQTLMKLDIDNLDTPYIHVQPKGCVNDFCGDKKQIIFKLQSANICKVCSNGLKEAGIDRSILSQCLHIFSSIRKQFIIDPEEIAPVQPLRLELNSYGIFFPDLGNKKLALDAARLVFYISLLRFSNGISFLHLQNKEDHLNIMKRLYNHYADNRENDPVKTFMRDTNSFATYRRPINNQIEKMLPKEFVSHFQIGNNADLNRILFDRTLLKIDERMAHYNLTPANFLNP